MPSFKNINDKAHAKIENLDTKAEHRIPRFLLNLFQPSTQQQCSILDISHFRNNRDARLLKPKTHHLVEKGRLLEDFAPTTPNTPMSKLQKAAYAKLQKYQTSARIMRPDIEAKVREYYALFDDLYFFGKLKNIVVLEFGCLYDGRGGYRMGVTTFEKFDKVLETVLHEMIDAFFFVFICDYEDYISDAAERRTAHGHGRTWVCIVYTTLSISRFVPDAKFKWAEDGWMLREKTEPDGLEDEELLSMTGWN